MSKLIKYLAMLVFIVLPFVGFYLGAKYQRDQKIEIANSETATNCIELFSSLKDNSQEYFSHFFDALKRAATDRRSKETVKCFSESPDLYNPNSLTYKVNLEKDYSDFIFSVGNAEPASGPLFSIVPISITHSDNEVATILLYVRGMNGPVKISDIVDSVGFFK